jgi:hypothetical protein
MTKVSIDPRISLGTILNIIVVISAVVIAFGYLQSDVNAIKKQHQVYDEVHQSLQNRTVTREQLDYQVIQRLDRFERRLDVQLQRIEAKLEEQ